MKATSDISLAAREAPPYQRRLGWLGTAALAMGGSNQSLFLIAALFAGQDDIVGQGSAAVPLLVLGLLLAYAALPGWIELTTMSPNRVGGIAASCVEAFRPYGPILSTLTGVCYWWGWVPTCGLTAILSATAIHQWYLPAVPIPVLACALVAAFTALNLRGIEWVARAAVPIATCSALLAFVSALAPVIGGTVDWHRAFDYRLTTPFEGTFGRITSLMAGLYLIGFAAPAFEAAACHAAETKDPARNVPRAMKASAAMASIYFFVLPVVWLGTLGAGPLGTDLGQALGPTFAPVFGALAKSAAIWFMMFNMFHGTLQPLAGASRTLSQLADDGLAPRWLSKRNAAGVPTAATVLTAGSAIVFLLIGDPIWLVAAANFTYLIGIAAPSVAVWLLRRDAPQRERPYRAPRGTIGLGVAAAATWGLSTVLGFEQFGLPTVVFGLAMAYSGAAVYAWRKWEDRRRAGHRGIAPTLHLRLTGAMLLVLALDGAGYILAISQLPRDHAAMTTLLADIFVAVAMLTITVGIVLPGVIAHSATEVSRAARELCSGTLRDFSKAMSALGRGDLDAACAEIKIRPVEVRSNDELGQMAQSFNVLQLEVATAAEGLDDAREGLRSARARLTHANKTLQRKFVEQQQLAQELAIAKRVAEEANAAKSQFMARMSHELRTPLNGVLGSADLLLDLHWSGEQHVLLKGIRDSGAALKTLVEQILDMSQIEADKLAIEYERFDARALLERVAQPFAREAAERGVAFSFECEPFAQTDVWSDAGRIAQIASNLLSNAVKFTTRGAIRFEAGLVKAGGGAMLSLVVSDTGPGIAPQDQADIYRSFMQADESITRRHDGAGVGLFLVRELVKRLGGQIDLDSDLGRGACFTVVLPVALPHAATALQEALRAQSEWGNGSGNGIAARVSTDETGRTGDDMNEKGVVGRRILLAEDNPVNRAVALASLRRMALGADVAHDGEEAIALFGRNAYDLILMDCHMPGTDGIAATAAIRAIEQERGTPAVPVIAVTADLTPENVARCRAVGMADVLAKPFTFADFSARVSQCLHGVELAEGPRVQPEPEDAVIDVASLDELRALADDDAPTVAHEIVELFLRNAVTQMRALCDAVAAGDLAGAGELAHTLKSSCAYVGATGLSALMRQIDADARAGDASRLPLLARRSELAFAQIATQLQRAFATGSAKS